MLLYNTLRADLKFWRSQTPFRAHFSGVCGAPAGVSGAVMRVCGASRGFLAHLQESVAQSNSISGAL